MKTQTKIPIFCPYCNGQHIDEGKYAIKPHKQHLCFHCGRKFWLPRATIGVGNKNKILDGHLSDTTPQENLRMESN